MNQNEITYGTCTQILISWLRYVHKSGKDLFFKLQVEVPVTSTPPPQPPLFFVLLGNTGLNTDVIG